MTSTVLVVNGSPKMKRGNTSLFLAPFVRGMEQAGARVETIYSKELDIKPCIGGLKCWFETIGKCIYDDDMRVVLSKMRQADILVFATPVYIQLPSKLQNLLNRMVPLMEPRVEFREGRTRAKLHKDVRFSKIVLVVTNGWWERENSDTVVRIFRELAETSSVEFVGPFVRPHAIMLREEGQETERVLQAMMAAGQQLIKEGGVSDDLFQAVSTPLVSQEEHLQRSLRNYERALNSARNG